MNHKESSTWTEYLSYIKVCQWIQARYKLNFRYEIKLELRVSEKLYYGGLHVRNYELGYVWLIDRKKGKKEGKKSKKESVLKDAMANAKLWETKLEAVEKSRQEYR